MGFFARPAKLEDLDALLQLAGFFTLLNLPADREILQQKISRSILSFSKQLEPQEREFLFVLEEQATAEIAGCSLILAKHGTPAVPHYAFCVEKQERLSEDLGIGFIHHLLRLKEETDGPSEIGGLLLHPNFRGHPQKLGKLISLARFMYIACHRDSFADKILCEFAPRLSEDGQSLLWEELGRKFTGLTYQEADRLSLKNKNFIRQLFPIEAIYLNLLSPEVRMNLGKVSPQTEPALHLLASLGFRYLGEIDPFDGGPHYGCSTAEISLVRALRKSSVAFAEELRVRDMLVLREHNDQLMICWGENDDEAGVVRIESHWRELGATEAEQVYCANI